MRTAILLTLFFLNYSGSEIVSEFQEESHIPERYRKDWRLFCNVCNNFIREVRINLLNKTGDREYDFELRTGYRLDSAGKMESPKLTDITKSEIKLTEILDSDICKGRMNAAQVVYDKSLEGNLPVRMLLKNETFSETKTLKLSRKRKNVNKANWFCAQVNDLFYEQIVEAFIGSDSNAVEQFCKARVDYRCGLLSSLIKPSFLEIDSEKWTWRATNEILELYNGKFKDLERRLAEAAEVEEMEKLEKKYREDVIDLVEDIEASKTPGKIRRLIKRNFVSERLEGELEKFQEKYNVLKKSVKQWLQKTTGESKDDL